MDGISILVDIFFLLLFSHSFFFLPISLWEEQWLPRQLGIKQARGSRGKVEAELSSLGGLINHSTISTVQLTITHTHSHIHSFTHTVTLAQQAAVGEFIVIVMFEVNQRYFIFYCDSQKVFSRI